MHTSALLVYSNISALLCQSEPISSRCDKATVCDVTSIHNTNGLCNWLALSLHCSLSISDVVVPGTELLRLRRQQLRGIEVQPRGTEPPRHTHSQLIGAIRFCVHSIIHSATAAHIQHTALSCSSIHNMQHNTLSHSSTYMQHTALSHSSTYMQHTTLSHSSTHIQNSIHSTSSP